VRRYLHSIKKIIGALLAFVGVLATPGKKRIDLTSGFDSNDVRQALDTQVRNITGKVPPEVMVRVLKIRQIVLGILPRSGNLPPGSPLLFIIDRIATDYLPTSLEAYLNLPRAYATSHPVQDGKTPTDVLLDQLALLENKMNEIADDIHRNDADRLLANGRFLEGRFGRSPLSPKPPPRAEAKE
jgi:hypothetical protein